MGMGAGNVVTPADACLRPQLVHGVTLTVYRRDHREYRSDDDLHRWMVESGGWPALGCAA